MPEIDFINVIDLKNVSAKLSILNIYGFLFLNTYNNICLKKIGLTNQKPILLYNTKNEYLY